MFILRHAELRVSNLIYTVKCILFMEFGRLKVKCQGITYLFWLYIATLQGSNTYLLVVIYRNRSKQSANLNNAMSHSKLRLNMQPVSKAGKCAQAKTWLLFYFWLVDKKRANKETNKQTLHEFWEPNQDCDRSGKGQAKNVSSNWGQGKFREFNLRVLQFLTTWKELKLFKFEA